MWYEIFKFELTYRSKRWDTYAYFLILFLYGLIAVDFLFGTHLNTVNSNAPYLIALTMAVVSALFTMITSMIMGVAALRDFDHKMESLMFINPISKLDYLLGRFLGSFVILLFIFGGLMLGLFLGNYMPWRAETSPLDFQVWAYMQPFLFIVLPNLFFGGALFFVGGALSRKLLVVYTQGIVFLTFYLFTLQLSQSADNNFLAGVLDPFCYQTIKVLVKYWTVDIRNVQLIPIVGVVFYNRLLWIALGFLTLVIGYWGFSFNVVRTNRIDNFSRRLIFKRPLKSSIQKINLQKITFTSPTKLNWQAKLIQLQYHSLFYFKSILKEIPFWAIIICATAIIFINSINLGTSFGVNSYPLTYIIVEELQEMTVFFFLMIVVFYSGELVWKERDTNIDALYDSSPIADSINLIAKYFGLLLTYATLLIAIIIAGIAFQTSQGYYHYELDVYFVGFFLSTFVFLALFTALAFFFQTIVNHKFIGHLLIVTFFFLGIISLEILGIDHGLYTFGSGYLGAYSDMNGYGHFLASYGWLTAYWAAFSILLLIIAILFAQRGVETEFKQRWQSSKLRLTKPLIKVGLDALLLFIGLGCFIFYNTNILNRFAYPSTQNSYRAAYEKTLKKYENTPQPKIINVNLKVELYPSERNYVATGYFMLKNESTQPIHKIYVQKKPDDDLDLASVDFSRKAIKDATYEKFGFYSYQLNEPLSIDDSLKMEFKQTYFTKGFTENIDTKIVYNGTFFDNFELPTFGYNPYIELDDEKERIENGLLPKTTTAKRQDSKAVKEHRSGMDSKRINFEIILGTAADQIAIAPGQLQKEWTEHNRHYFHYKMAQPMINFYPIVSAKYQVFNKEWTPQFDSLQHPINLEIYYQKGHEYNLDRMMSSMEKSFDYFTENFGIYPYRQMRIVETPRYLDRAQSFPSMVTYAESMGFIMDIDDTEDVDMPFFITAHELAHQWWGLQVPAANVQGRKMILESLAQYSALMVLKKHYPKEKVQQLLAFERERYLEGNAVDIKHKLPLALEDNQSYVYYSKGALNLYALQEYISEDSVNLALKRFIQDWNIFDGPLQTNRYATTEDLLGYFRAVTPDSMQYVISDLFEKMILFDNKITAGSYEQLVNNQYKVNLKLAANKYEINSLGTETSIDINDWIEIGVYAQDTTETDQLVYTQKHKITSQITDIEILVNQAPSKVGISPFDILIDKNSEDDLIKIEKRIH